MDKPLTPPQTPKSSASSSSSSSSSRHSSFVDLAGEDVPPPEEVDDELDNEMIVKDIPDEMNTSTDPAIAYQQQQTPDVIEEENDEESETKDEHVPPTGIPPQLLLDGSLLHNESMDSMLVNVPSEAQIDDVAENLGDVSGKGQGSTSDEDEDEPKGEGIQSFEHSTEPSVLPQQVLLDSTMEHHESMESMLVNVASEAQFDDVADISAAAEEVQHFISEDQEADDGGLQLDTHASQESNSPKQSRYSRSRSHSVSSSSSSSSKRSEKAQERHSDISDDHSGIHNFFTGI